MTFVYAMMNANLVPSLDRSDFAIQILQNTTDLDAQDEEYWAAHDAIVGLLERRDVAITGKAEQKEKEALELAHERANELQTVSTERDLLQVRIVELEGKLREMGIKP